MDSTAAPDIILMPISGWAAFIAATMTGILNENGVTEFTGYEAFIVDPDELLRHQRSYLYLASRISSSSTFGPMRKHEERGDRRRGTSRYLPQAVPGEANRLHNARGWQGRRLPIPARWRRSSESHVIGALWIGISNTEGSDNPDEDTGEH